MLTKKYKTFSSHIKIELKIYPSCGSIKELPSSIFVFQYHHFETVGRMLWFEVPVYLYANLLAFYCDSSSKMWWFWNTGIEAFFICTKSGSILNNQNRGVKNLRHVFNNSVAGTNHWVNEFTPWFFARMMDRMSY